MANIKQQSNTVIFGTNGTGKTTFMLRYAAAYIEAHPEKNILAILADNGERKYDPIPRIKAAELENINGFFKIFAGDFPYSPGGNGPDGKKLVFKTAYEALYHYFVPQNDEGYQRRFNGLIINDDCGVLFGRRPEDVLDLFRKRRQANADIISNFHGLTTDMPRSFFMSLTSIILFKTGDAHEDTRDKLPAPLRQAFEDMYFRVEERAKEDPFYFEELKLRL